MSLLNKTELVALDKAIEGHTFDETSYCAVCGPTVCIISATDHWIDLAFKAGERYAARAIRDGRTE